MLAESKIPFLRALRDSRQLGPGYCTADPKFLLKTIQRKDGLVKSLCKPLSTKMPFPNST